MSEERPGGPVERIVRGLHEAASEIASAGHPGWGNVMTEAADEIERLQADAARYRFLLEKVDSGWEVTRWIDSDTQELILDLSTAIDEQMMPSQTPNAAFSGTGTTTDQNSETPSPGSV